MKLFYFFITGSDLILSASLQIRITGKDSDEFMDVHVCIFV